MVNSPSIPANKDHILNNNIIIIIIFIEYKESMANNQSIKMCM